MEYFKPIACAFHEGRLRTMQELQDILNYSERKVAMLIKDLREISQANGFEILTVRSYGYKLVVHNEDKYRAFIDTLSESESWLYNDQNKRVNAMISILLATDGYISIDEIARTIDVSRSTVLRDVNSLRDQLQDNHLKLISKRYYGLRISGNEQIKRRLFGQISSQIDDCRNLPENYSMFVSQIDRNKLASQLYRILEEDQIVISSDGLELLISHILITLYRLKNKNLISEFNLDEEILPLVYIKTAEKILWQLQAHQEFSFNDLELMMLAAQLMIYSSIQKIPPEFMEATVPRLKTMLFDLDKEFDTQMGEDRELINALINHIYPLKLRAAMQFRLANPFASMIPVRYTYALLIALRFVEAYDDPDFKDLSMDEIAYLALHFTTHFEREHQKAIEGIRNILYVSSSDRANILLSKTLLENSFVNSNILVKSPQMLSAVKVEDVDLILYEEKSLKYLNEDFINYGYPVSGLISEADLDVIKHSLWVHRYTLSSLQVEQLFNKQCLFIEDELTDYLQILSKYANKMIELGYAADNYAESLIERELRFSTVYENGIAAPHSMQQDALLNSVAIIYCKKAVTYQGKNVEIIFMINIMKGYLFLYQEISDLMIFAINNAQKFKFVLENKDFDGLQKLLKERRRDGRDHF